MSAHTDFDVEISDALSRIADEIEPFELPWRKAWEEFLEAPSRAAQDRLAVAVADLNRVIETKVGDIARLTKNAVDNIHALGRPRPTELYDAWFVGGPYDVGPSAYIRKVAEHASFNRRYWGERESEAERSDLLARSTPRDPVIGAEEAVQHMKAGRVPNIRSIEFIGRSGGFHRSAMDIAMRAGGLLEHYDKTHDDRVSTTQSVGFVMVSGDDEKTFVYWPGKAAVSRWERIQLETVEVGEAAPESPRG